MFSTRSFIAVAFVLVASTAQAASVQFSSECDFIRTVIEIEGGETHDEDPVELNVTLSKNARQRLHNATQASMEAPLKTMLQLAVDGHEISSTKIVGALDTENLIITMPRHLLRELAPSLLASHPAPRCTTSPL